MNNMRRFAGYELAGLILTLGVLGARLQSNLLLFAMLAGIVVAVVLVTFDKISEKQYPLLIYFMTLGLIYQMTLMSNYIVGTDIHYEYYYALQTYNNGFWDYTIPHSYNAAVSISVFLPTMARLLHIPLVWSFKVIPPLFLSGVPVVAYFIFKREFGAKAAFLSTFFFISVPTMFLELSGLAKQAIGELFLILCLGLVAYDAFKLRWKRYLLIGLFGGLTVVSHYTMGGTLFCYLLGAIALLLTGKFIFRLKPNIHIGYLSVTVVTIAVFGILFYGWAAQGTALHGITDTAVAQVDGTTATTATTPTTPIEPSSDLATQQLRDARHWITPDPAISMAIGLDFRQVGPLAKLFRIFQYATEFLVVVGLLAILVRHKRYSLGYLVLVLLSGILLTMTVFLPGFAPTLNASRFYNLVLLFAAPAIVVGGKLVFRNYKVLAIGLLAPYFIFTSGAVFELSGAKDISTPTIPYSHALSAYRTDSTALYTPNDILARDWVATNAAFPVYGDLWGAIAVTEVHTTLGYPLSVGTFAYIGSEGKPRPVPDDCYIILRERNTEKQELTYHYGAGLRRTVSYAGAGFYDVLQGRDVLYRAGDALVYSPKPIADKVGQ